MKRGKEVIINKNMSEQKQWWENEEDYYRKKDGFLKGGYQDWGYNDYEQDLGFDYGFDQSLKETNINKELDEYNKTGKWKGWKQFQRPQLDYKYVEQMANAFAGRYGIEVKIGNYWAIDLKNKVLIYDPLTLLQGSKANLMAILLHEIGHLRHSTHHDSLSSVWFKYRGAEEIMNLFEDFRVDDLMKHSYEGAEGVFEANEPIIEALAKGYKIASERLKKEVIMALKRSLLYIQSNYEGVSLELKLKKEFGTSTIEETHKKMLETIIDIENKHTLFDYLSAMCIEGYGGKIKTDDTKLRARIDKTKPFVKSVIKAKSTQDVINILDKKVYPVIKDLLEEAESGFKEVSERFTKGVAKESMAVAELSIKEEGHDGLKSTQYVSAINEFGDRVGEVKTLTPRVKSSGRSNATMPPKWTDGDYAALKESVNSSVRELIRKMTFIRKQDSVPRWIGHQRVGKINTRGIYKYKTGSQKIFKKKIEMPDRIANFAFSAVIDVSGSMEGDRIIHTTRGLVLLSEVFDKMKIPFEIVAFSNGASVVKGFNEDYDNAKKKQLGGLVKDFRGGGTNLDEAFKAITIKQCSERNKIMILLSDGGVGSKEFYDSYFKDFEKHKIQTIGVGLCCGNEIVDLCKGNGFVTDEVGKLPLKFVELLKSIIK